MLQNSRIPFQADLCDLVIGPEIKHRLGDLIETARLSLKPRDFAENCLVDEMAISKWRGIRTKIMEKAVYDHQATTYRPRGLKTTDGTDAEPYEDMYHLACAHSPEASRIVLTALGRLETRYYRHFCGSFRLLLTARRGTPLPLTDLEQALHPLSNFTPKKVKEEKENTTCEPSPNSSHTTK
jgi:hypothetical protein